MEYADTAKLDQLAAAVEEALVSEYAKEQKEAKAITTPAKVIKDGEDRVINLRYSNCLPNEVAVDLPTKSLDKRKFQKFVIRTDEHPEGSIF